MMEGAPDEGDATGRDLGRKYEAIAYAAQANPLSHPRHLATVATLLGLDPPDVATCRVLEVGCSDGANLLPMAAGLPNGRFVGCDISSGAIAAARSASAELGLANAAFVERDLAMLSGDEGSFDYILAHGVYSWVPTRVREALLELAARRLSPNGVMFVSLNVYPGCHVREAAWGVLHHHVDGIEDVRARLDATRAFAALMAEPAMAQSEVDALLRHEFKRLASETDSALFHDDLAVPNDPVYFHEFAAHLARHGLAYLADAKLSMMTAAGLAQPMQQLVATMDRLQREQYLDFARLRRFRQAIVCRADKAVTISEYPERVSTMHAAASMPLVRAAAEGKPYFGDPASRDANLLAARRILQRLIDVAPRIVPVAELATWQREHAADDIVAARPLNVMLIEACYAGTVDLYVDAPKLAAVAGDRPTAPPLVRWQAAKGGRVTNLRHESLRIDDPMALKVLTLCNGTRTRAEIGAGVEADVPPAERGSVDQRVALYLARFSMHGLLAG